MKKERERLTIYNKKTGNRYQLENGFFVKYYDDLEKAKKFLENLKDPDAIICVEEIYIYYDNAGNFQRKETYTLPL